MSYWFKKIIANIQCSEMNFTMKIYCLRVVGKRFLLINGSMAYIWQGFAISVLMFAKYVSLINVRCFTLFCIVSYLYIYIYICVV